ncbi:ATP-binding protein [Actinokineospora pegani]|uniref:ATP-binding protein n=1 Tax=Actinokineospora pegani TaxID=2654637 RepID=UPI0018D3169C|nr:ATP-binding protein [Actinokineospora pegani]
MTDVAVEPPQSCRVVLARELAAVSTTRQVVGTFLRRQDVAEPVTTDVLIVANEAVTNAVQHGGPETTVTVDLLVSDDLVTLRVHDVGPWPPPDERVDDDHRLSLTVVEGIVRPRFATTAVGGTELTADFPWAGPGGRALTRPGGSR